MNGFSEPALQANRCAATGVEQPLPRPIHVAPIGSAAEQGSDGWHMSIGVHAFLKSLAAESRRHHLSLTSPLRDWQTHWRGQGILSVLMSATVPLAHGVWRISELSEAVHHQALGESSVSEWPLYGLRLFIEHERRRLNELSTSTGIVSDQCFRNLTSHGRVRPRSALFLCITEGLDAPLLSWLHVWHYLDVLRVMCDVLPGRVIPRAATLFLADSDQPCWRILAPDADVIRYEVAIGGMLADYRVLGEIRVSRDDLLCYVSLPDTDHDFMPIDIVGTHHGGHHHAVMLPYWCPLSMAVRRAIKSDRYAAATGMLSDNAPRHVLGLRLQRLDSPAEDAGADDLDNPDALSELPMEAVEHLDTALLTGEAWVLSRDDRPFRMPGVYPDTWFLSRGCGGVLLRNMRIGELVLTRWIHAAATRIGLYDPKCAVQLDASDEAETEPDAQGFFYKLYNRLTSGANQADDLSGRLLPVYGSGDALANTYGASRYRIPLLSLVLEEASYLRCRSSDPLPYIKAYTVAHDSSFSVTLGINRKSLALIRRVAGLVRRLGMRPEDMQRWVRRMLLDLACESVADMGTRYQLVRDSLEQYQVYALPYWHVPSDWLTCIREQERRIGGALHIEKGVGEALVRNPNLIKLLGRCVGMPAAFITQALTEAYRALADTAPAYIEQLERLSGQPSASLCGGGDVSEFARPMLRMKAVVDVADKLVS